MQPPATTILPEIELYPFQAKCRVIRDGVMTISQFAEAQSASTTLSKSRMATVKPQRRGPPARIEMHGGLVFHVVGKKARICFPDKFINDYIMTLHHRGGHLTKNQIFRCIENTYFVPDLKQKLDEIVGSCYACTYGKAWRATTPKTREQLRLCVAASNLLVFRLGTWTFTDQGRIWFLGRHHRPIFTPDSTNSDQIQDGG